MGLWNFLKTGHWHSKTERVVKEKLNLLTNDMEVSSISRTLEVFQFPVLYRKADLASKIKVIRKSISSVNSIQY